MNYPMETNTLLHSLHSSSVSTLVYEDSSKCLISGGADCKVLSFDVHENRKKIEYKFPGSVANVQIDPSNPSLMMVTVTNADYKIYMFDCRSNSSAFKLRWDEVKFDCIYNLNHKPYNRETFLHIQSPQCTKAATI